MTMRPSISVFTSLPTLVLALACGSESSDGGDAVAGAAGTLASAGTTSGGSASSGAAGVAGSSAGATSSGGAGAAGTAATAGNGGAALSGGTGGGSFSAGSGGQAGGGSKSAGCGASAATGLFEREITVGSQKRTYLLSIPSNYRPDPPLPLVFAWHGRGGSGSLARRYFQIEEISKSGGASSSPFVVVYPDGLPTGAEQSSGWDLAANGIDLALFDALVEEVSSEYCVDLERVFSTGHSFGGMMSNALGCYRGDVLRAIAPVAGMPPRGGGRNGVMCAGEVAAWIAHGDNDDVVDFEDGGVATRDFWLERNACSTTESQPIAPSPCVEYAGCQSDLAVHWCVHQSEHDWPSFAGPGIRAFFTSF